MSTTIIMGDIGEGAKWWSTANFLKIELERTYRRNNHYMQAWKQVSADVRIFVVMRSGIPWAFIYAGSEGYMESGILDLLNLGVFNADTYKPARIRLTEHVQQLMPTYINASKKRLIVENDESYAIGEKEKVGHKDIYNDFGDLVGFLDIDPPEFCATVDIFSRKKMALKFPPSVFTGRMRDFVQAIYGTARTDFYADFKNNELRFDLGFKKDANGEYILNALGDKIPDILQINPFADGGCGIYELPNKRFAMVHFSSSGLTIYARMLVPSGAKVMEYGADLDPKIIDSYLFATLKPSQNAVVIGSLSGEINNYAPLAYGWHFNKEGTHAIRAGRASVSLTGTTIDGLSQAIGGWLCTLFEMDIALSLDDAGVLTGSASIKTLIEPVPFIPNQQTAIYTPIYPSGGMLNWNESLDVYINASGAPIYAYYDENSEPIIATMSEGDYSYELSYARPPNSGSIMDVLYTGEFFDTDYYRASEDASRSQTYTSSGGGLSINDNVYQGIHQYSALLQFTDTVLTGAETYPYHAGVAGDYLGVYLEVGDYTAIKFPLGSSGPSYNDITTVTNTYRRIVPFLIIPYLDAEAMFFGTSTDTDATLDTRERLYFGNNVTYKINGQYTNQTNASAFYSGSTAFYVLPDDTPDPRLQPKFTGELYAITSNNIIPVGTGGTLIPRIGIIDFNPKTGFLATEFLFKSSIGKSYMYSIPTYFEGFNDWPTDLQIDGGPIGYA